MIINAKYSSRPRTFATPWTELQYVCAKANHWLYTKRDRANARRYRVRLARVLAQLPENDEAILKVDGLALLHELQGELSCAQEHRKREIELIENLHDSVRRSVTSGQYDAKMGSHILADWDEAELRKRRAILEEIERKLAHGDGSPTNGARPASARLRKTLAAKK